MKSPKPCCPNLVKENANSPDLFSLAKFSKKVKKIFKKIAKIKYFWDFQLWEFEKIRKNGEISTHGSSRLPIRYKYVLFLKNSYLVYSQIWLNLLPMEDCHFDYITILQRETKNFNLLDWTINCAYMQFKGHIMITLTKMNMIMIRPLLLKYPLECEQNLNRFSRSLHQNFGPSWDLSVPNSNHSNYHQKKFN